jgi:hypothetical protein
VQVTSAACKGPRQRSYHGGMPLTTVRDDARRRLFVIGTGEVTVADSIAFIDQQAREGTWSYSVLYDGRQRETTLPEQDLRMLADYNDQAAAFLGPQGPLAVVRADTAGFSSARSFSVLSAERHRQVAVFTDLEAAGQWLDAVAAAST